MEKPNINKERRNNEVTLVKKGLFYYIFQLIALPFRLLFWIFKVAWKYISIYFGWAKEYLEDRTKKKHLNKILLMNRLKEEIL